jgi:hypothetical protein
MFWRNLAGSPVSAMAAHAGVVTIELLGSMARPRMFVQLAARLLACCQLGSYVRHHHALDQLGLRALRPRATHEHMRIDRSHKAPSHIEPARANLHSH